jgi:hypothetical protein
MKRMSGLEWLVALCLVALLGTAASACSSDSGKSSDDAGVRSMSSGVDAGHVNQVLRSIALEPALATLAVGESASILAQGTFDDGSVRDVTDSMTWSSSLASFTVTNGNSAGVVSAGAMGRATITATDGTTGIAATALAFATPLNDARAAYRKGATMIDLRGKGIIDWWLYGRVGAGPPTSDAIASKDDGVVDIKHARTATTFQVEVDRNRDGQFDVAKNVTFGSAAVFQEVITQNNVGGGTTDHQTTLTPAQGKPGYYNRVDRFMRGASGPQVTVNSTVPSWIRQSSGPIGTPGGPSNDCGSVLDAEVSPQVDLAADVGDECLNQAGNDATSQTVGLIGELIASEPGGGLQVVCVQQIVDDLDNCEGAAGSAGCAATGGCALTQTNATGQTIIQITPAVLESDPSCGNVSSTIFHELLHAALPDEGINNEDDHNATNANHNDSVYGCETWCFGNDTEPGGTDMCALSLCEGNCTVGVDDTCQPGGCNPDGSCVAPASMGTQCGQTSGYSCDGFGDCCDESGDQCTTDSTPPPGSSGSSGGSGSTSGSGSGSDSGSVGSSGNGSGSSGSSSGNASGSSGGSSGEDGPNSGQCWSCGCDGVTLYTNIGDCVSGCKTNLSCFTDICIPTSCL